MLCYIEEEIILTLIPFIRKIINDVSSHHVWQLIFKTVPGGWYSPPALQEQNSRDTHLPFSTNKNVS